MVAARVLRPVLLHGSLVASETVLSELEGVLAGLHLVVASASRRLEGLLWRVVRLEVHPVLRGAPVGFLFRRGKLTENLDHDFNLPSCMMTDSQGRERLARICCKLQVKTFR